ncbi:MAG: MerR family transcriptional regulator [Nitrosomonas sp.]|nr:MerR family transcriptional regulator [Nitrosomonas sp.]
MENNILSNTFPPIPAKRYFTIGEVGELCGVKPHVLRYWEQEFVQLKPVKRRGNRRYYQQQEVLLIRKIRKLLYDEGFTINGARNQLGRKRNETQPVINTVPVINASTTTADLTQLKGEIKSVISLLRS